MTPASKGRIVAMANNVVFITDLLVAPCSQRSPIGTCAAQTRAAGIKGTNLLGEAILGNYSETKPCRGFQEFLSKSGQVTPHDLSKIAR